MHKLHWIGLALVVAPLAFAGGACGGDDTGGGAGAANTGGTPGTGGGAATGGSAGAGTGGAATGGATGAFGGGAGVVFDALETCPMPVAPPVPMRPRDSASRPTASQAASATATQPFP